MNHNIEDLRFIVGQSHPELGRKICDHLGIKPVEVDFGVYPEGNQWVQIKKNVRERRVIILQTSCPPVDFHVIQGALLIDAARSASADKITYLAPYFAYVRQDKKDRGRIPIGAKLMCDIFTKAAGAYRLGAVTLHSDTIQGFANVFDNLKPNRYICSALQEQSDLGINRDGWIVLAPDNGSSKMNSRMAQRLGLSYVGLIDKQRTGDEEVEIINLIADPEKIRGKKVLMFDDEIQSGGTAETVADYLVKEIGVQEVHFCAVHGVFTKGSLERINASSLTKVIVTNTIPQKHNGGKIIVIDISKYLANCIKNIYLGESVSALF